MAINFTALAPTNGQQTVATEVQAHPSGESLSLRKDQFLDLTKAAPTLRNAKLAAGWDTLTAGVDLDLSAILLGADDRYLGDDHFIFFNHLNAYGCQHSGDNRTGLGDGDDEVISVDLNNVPADVEKIIVNVTIQDALSKRQTFGMVQNAFVRLVDADTNKELAKFDLTDDYSTSTAIVFAELVRGSNGWNFHTLGQGLTGELKDLLVMYRGSLDGVSY